MFSDIPDIDHPQLITCGVVDAEAVGIAAWNDGIAAWNVKQSRAGGQRS
jgi:hypothetical protein